MKKIQMQGPASRTESRTSQVTRTLNRHTGGNRRLAGNAGDRPPGSGREVPGVTTSPPQAGRPRDPDVDRRVADAAITLFGETGWAGFSVEAVAKRASGGKASIYLRWPTKEALLVEALRLRVGIIDDVDTGSLREDLIRLARQILDLYLGDAGRAALRLGLEGDLIPGLADQLGALRTSQVRAARGIVRRGIRR